MSAGRGQDELDKAVGYVVSRLHRRIKQEIRRVYADNRLDVTPEQAAVLHKLYLNDGMSQSELAEDTWKDKPTITRILDSLEGRGLVVRGRDPSDRRRYRIHLTMAGSELRDKLYPLGRNLHDKLISGFGKEELETVRISLERMLANLE